MRKRLCQRRGWLPDIHLREQPQITVLAGNKHRSPSNWGWIFFWALLIAFGFLLTDTNYLLKRLKEAEQPPIMRRGCVQVEFSGDGKNWTPQDHVGARSIWIVQYLTKIQVVDFLARTFSSEQVSVEPILFLGSVLSVTIAVGGFAAWKNFGRLKRAVTVCFLVMGAYLALTYLGAVGAHRWYWVALAAALGAALGLVSRPLLSPRHAPE